ncbi:metal ABC transporter substrate-binding lipoprotein family protein [Peptoniphilus sp. oral taxon 375 str. F0436]|nr:metal ABC transporter substrate-binding lipoprotein family protein [Peptoniphilus sp. oral taxon 375 str. F0436]
MRKKGRYLVVLLALACLTACGGGEKKSNKPLVYTSFFPIQDMTKMIAGDTVDVESFMPVDKEPHLWEPSPKDMKKLAKADLLVVNGANMEPWLDQVKENLPKLDILKLSDSVDLISYKGAAAIGDFQYMTELDLDKQKHEIEFGHTHENVMRVCFFKQDGSKIEDLVKKGKNIWRPRENWCPKILPLRWKRARSTVLKWAMSLDKSIIRCPRRGSGFLSVTGFQKIFCPTTSKILMESF